MMSDWLYVGLMYRSSDRIPGRSMNRLSASMPVRLSDWLSVGLSVWFIGDYV